MNTKTKSRPMRPASAKHRIVLMLTALLFAANAAVAQMTVSGTCGKTENDNVTWTYTTLASMNILTIAGIGEMADYLSDTNPNTAPWYNYKDDIKTVVIGEGVTNIGNVAFFQFTKLTAVTIPANVTSIGDFAFQGSGLTSIAFADDSQLTSIGTSAFLNCSGLSSITIPASVKSIGDNAFAGCNSVSFIKIDTDADVSSAHLTIIKDGIQYVVLSKSTATIDGAIKNSGDLIIHSEIKAGNVFSIYEIPNVAFQMKTGITSVVIDEGITSVGQGAFAGCSGLTSITTPASVTRIGSVAFFGSGLTSVTILASSLEVYGPDAFAGNPAGRKIYVPKASVDTYKAGWPDYADYIFPIPDDPTSIGNATMPSGNAQAADEAWYSLSGAKLNAKPTERGVYLHQGRKVVVK